MVRVVIDNTDYICSTLRSVIKMNFGQSCKLCVCLSTLYICTNVRTRTFIALRLIQLSFRNTCCCVNWNRKNWTPNIKPFGNLQHYSDKSWFFGFRTLERKPNLIYIIDRTFSNVYLMRHFHNIVNFFILLGSVFDWLTFYSPLFLHW